MLHTFFSCYYNDKKAKDYCTMLLSNHDEYLVLYKYYFVSDSSTFSFLFVCLTSALYLHIPLSFWKETAHLLFSSFWLFWMTLSGSNSFMTAEQDNSVRYSAPQELPLTRHGSQSDLEARPVNERLKGQVCESQGDDWKETRSRRSSRSDGVGSGHTIINDPAAYQTKPGDIRYPTEHDPNPFELKTYPTAWIVLSLVVLLRTAVAIFGSTFSPIPKVIAEFLGVSLSEINWLYNIMGITYIIISCVTSWLYEAMGVKWSVSTCHPILLFCYIHFVLKKLFAAGMFLTIGCWIRWIAVKITPPSFGVMMLGQTIASISAPLSLNIMTVVRCLFLVN